MNKPITELKPIETRYKGFLFRSRLEARWALFLDALNINWFYEHEGYDLDGLWYLPDFYLPTFHNGAFIEVKPFAFLKAELEKAERLCLISGKIVILAIDVPDFICYEYYYRETCKGVTKVDKAYGIINGDQAYDENRMFVYPGYENADLTIDKRNWDSVGDNYLTAVELAKGGRF